MKGILHKPNLLEMIANQLFFVVITNAPTNLGKISSACKQHLNTSRDCDLDTVVYSPKYDICVTSDSVQLRDRPKVEVHPDTNAKYTCQRERINSEICGVIQSQPPTDLVGSRAESTRPNMQMESLPATRPGMDAPNISRNSNTDTVRFPESTPPNMQMELSPASTPGMVAPNISYTLCYNATSTVHSLHNPTWLPDLKPGPIKDADKASNVHNTPTNMNMTLPDLQSEIQSLASNETKINNVLSQRSNKGDPASSTAIKIPRITLPAFDDNKEGTFPWQQFRNMVTKHTGNMQDQEAILF